jgi:hypothetical protein
MHVISYILPALKGKARHYCYAHSHAIVEDVSAENKKFRDGLDLRKIKNKSKPVFELQYVDSWCLAAW